MDGETPPLPLSADWRTLQLKVKDLQTDRRIVQSLAKRLYFVKLLRRSAIVPTSREASERDQQFHDEEEEEEEEVVRHSETCPTSLSYKLHEMGANIIPAPRSVRCQ